MKTPRWFLSKNMFALALWPISVLYVFAHLGVFVIKRLARQHEKSSKTPVICVGGLLAGGVGKTPIVKMIATHLDAPVVMRGYGAKDSFAGHRVQKTDTARMVGDEAKMLSVEGLDVWIGDRAASISGVNSLIPAPRALVMDDGFQNPTIKKDVSILVFDENVGVGNGFCLPAGPLREPLWLGVRRCDAIIIVRDEWSPMNMADKLRRFNKPIFFATRSVQNPGLNGKVVAFAGIGYPKKFFDSVRSLARVRLIESVSFPDHHEYSKGDLVKLFQIAKKNEAMLVCTEKDWVKLPTPVRRKVKFLPMDVKLRQDFTGWLDKRILK